ncbi:polymorphic toxin type 44 domain-containing protein [Achromobacter sp.]|uniref:polymorphic toxin type 44 domain-containing protein n=1 Tax=Achromobacter sp. TaxID=134375 RepID=UPI0028B1105A|nr:polymorphic toxin type 44 domain-containing protein [Achromobacter sp.]
MHGKEIIGLGRKILNAGSAEPGASGARRSGCNHADTAVAIAEYMVREMKTNPFTIEARKIAMANAADPEEWLAKWRKEPWYARLVGPPDYYGAAMSQKLIAYAMWTERVAPNRPWDHKRILRAKFPTDLEAGWHKYGDCEYFLDIWSNIHYGYVGVALGFSAGEMINGAGLAQYLDNLRRREPQHDHPELGPWPASADDIQDHLSIKLGTDLYYDVPPHALTAEKLLERIVAVPLPWGAHGNRAKQRHACLQM